MRRCEKSTPQSRRQRLDRADRAGVVVERLAHAHEDHVGDALGTAVPSESVPRRASAVLRRRRARARRGAGPRSRRGGDGAPRPSVAVAQKPQPIAHPTCVDTQSVRRSPSGMSTLSIVAPSGSRSSSFRVPSVERDTVPSAGQPIRKVSASRRAQVGRQVPHVGEVARPVAIEPGRDLRRAIARDAGAPCTRPRARPARDRGCSAGSSPSSGLDRGRERRRASRESPGGAPPSAGPRRR